MFATRSRHGSLASRSRLAPAAAHASGLPMKVGPCMKTPGSPCRDRVAHRAARERGGEAHRAARERLAHAEQVGSHVRVLAREHAPRAPEAGRDLVRDQQHVALVAELAHAPQIVGRVEPHAARALHDRLEDHRGQLAAVVAQQARELAPVLLAARLVEAAARPLREQVMREHAREQRVHAGHGIADRHRAERVAVIGAAQREQALAARLPARLPVLERELDRDLDRDRARVAQEYALERARRERDEPLAQRDGGLVGETAEHHVREPLELRAHGGLDVRVAVAVDRRPPRRHAVDELAPVGEPEHRAARALHREQRLGDRRRVRVPDHAPIARDERVVASASRGHATRDGALRPATPRGLRLASPTPRCFSD